MTFLVESIDSRDLRSPLMSAASQSVSTFCGLLLPLCPSLSLWLPTCALSFVLYFYIWERLRVRTRTRTRTRTLTVTVTLTLAITLTLTLTLTSTLTLSLSLSLTLTLTRCAPRVSAGCARL